MIDLSILDNYLLELDFFSRTFLEQRVRKYGVDSVLKVQFECLDCTKKTSNGATVQQTNSYAYRNELSQTLEIINNYIEDKEPLLEKVIDIHNRNLQWEVDNPPTPAKYKRVKGERKSREKKETAAERKLKAQAAKIGKLSLKLKPVNGKENS